MLSNGEQSDEVRARKPRPPRPGRRSGVRTLRLTTVLPLATCLPLTSLAAQVLPPADDPVAEPESDPSDTPDSAQPAEGEDTIVVTGRRGDALVSPEIELGAEEISAFGANSIRELVEQLGPLTGRPDEGPIVLVNGKRADGARGVEDFPPEAIARVEVLPPEAAVRYGYPSSRRVVNIVMKRTFRAWQSEIGARLATAGGQTSVEGALGRYIVDGETSWFVYAQGSSENALRYADRRGVEIGSGAHPNRNLLPASDKATATLGLTHPLGDFSGTVLLNFNWQDQRRILGLASDDPARQLRADQTATSFGLTTMIDGNIAGWDSSLLARLMRSRSDSSRDATVLETDAAVATSRSINELLFARLNANRIIFDLPAGGVSANVTLEAKHNKSTSTSSLGQDGNFAISRTQWDARASLAVPVLGKDMEQPSPIGGLSFDLSGGASIVDGPTVQKQYELGANWDPVPGLEIRGVVGMTELVPTAEQLGGSYVEDVVSVYDATRGETTEVVRITGGNPSLGRGTSRTYSLRAAWKPFAPFPLTLASEYKRQSAQGGVAAFPALTPAVEAAFPDRIRRDGSGRLISIDARPIALERDLKEQLDNSLTLVTSPPKSPASDPKAGRGAAWRTMVSITHGWLLRSEIQTRPGLPVIDRAAGDTAQSRHTTGFRIIASRPGVGVTLHTTWKSGFTLRNPAPANGVGDLHYRPLSITNLNVHVEPARLLTTADKPKWLDNLRLSFQVRNLFDEYRQVRTADGSIAPGYRRYEIDPLGRTVKFSLTKNF